MKRYKKIWNKEEVEILINMKKERYSLKEMAMKYNVTVNAISKTLTRYTCNLSVYQIQNLQKNSFLDVIQWFNNLFPKRKILPCGKGFLYGREYLSRISTLIILNGLRLKHNKPLVNLQVRSYI
jgi:predicted DNA-binding protein YlxM (UPF0122 family)